MEIFGILVAWFLCAMLAGALAKEKGRSFALWAFFGIALGCFAVALAAVVPAIPAKAKSNE